jgi:hypothetical protein
MNDKIDESKIDESKEIKSFKPFKKASKWEINGLTGADLKEAEELLDKGLLPRKVAAKFGIHRKNIKRTN